MSIYVGGADHTLPVRKIYAGVGGLAMEVGKGYVGVEGVAQPIPLISFIHSDRVSIDVLPGASFLVQLSAKGVADFANTVLQLGYDPAALALEQFGLEDPSERDDAGGKTYAGNIQKVSGLPGRIRFQCVRPMRERQDWSGLVVAARFRALRAGNTRVSLS